MHDSLLKKISSTKRLYPKKQIILYQGEDIRDFFVIETGFVKAYDINSQGEEKILLILEKGDIFPIIWSFEKSTTHYFYETMTESEVIRGKKRDLINIVEGEESIPGSLFKYFIDKTNQLYLRIECLEATNAKYKVMQTVNYLSKFHSRRAKNGLCSVKIPLTHQDIANMTNLTRETVSIQMKELEELNIITQSTSQLEVNRRLLKEALAGA